jgi:hypothetical protein
VYGLPSGQDTPRRLTAIAFALLALVAFGVGFRWSMPQGGSDFEDCVDEVEAKQPANDERVALMTQCNARFAGRRKAGGGYSYYDFMQDRSFDIAGPNPTEEERREIDQQYMVFLDHQRLEALSVELAKSRNEQLQADMERARQPAGPPLLLTPRPSSPVAKKRPADRSRSARCEDGSLSCSWAKLSAAVKNAFGSSSGAKP